jgi:hypothetical protein
MTAVIDRRRGRRKVPVEKLREEHLSGPADQPIEKIASEMKDEQVVVFTEVPKYEKITFRNQRDPGHVLEFHYSSATHPFKQYKLIDGKQYDLPIEVIRNLEGCKENIHKYRRNADGLPEIFIAGYKSHFMCERA